MLSVTISSISIASFATVVGAPVGMMSASFAFSITTGIVKKLLKKQEMSIKTQNCYASQK